MDAQTYSNVTAACDQIAAKTQEPGISALSSRLHRALEKEHKPTMALVSFNMNHAERFAIIKDFTGTDVPGELAAKVDGASACILFDYSRSPGILSDGGPDGITVYGLPCEKLQTRRIAVCDAVKSRDKWFVLAEEIDIACLVINATMAMTQLERNWLRECGQPLFGTNEPVIATVGMNLLNTQEEVQAVNDAINGGLRRLGMSTQVFDSPTEAMAWMDDFLNDPAVQAGRSRRMAANGLTELTERTKAFMSTALIGSSAIDNAVAKLEEQRKSLQTAGQLASESILFNELTRLKVMASESVRDYGQRMVGNIKSKVETYPLEQLRGMDAEINQFIVGSWDAFLAKVAETTEGELQKVSARLTEQMEADAGNMIAALDEPTRRALYGAITFAPSYAERAENMPVRAPLEFSGVNINQMTQQLRHETRGMMLVSIPLLFVNPLFAVGSIVASKFIGKFRTDSELKNARADMAKQIENLCAANSEVVVQNVEASFDRQIQEGSQNVRAAYDNLINRLEGELNRMKTEQGQKNEVKRFLEEQLQSVIPSLQSQI